MLTFDHLQLIFPYEIASNFPTTWEGGIMDFLSSLKTNDEKRLNHLFTFADSKTIKVNSEVSKKCFLALEAFIKDNEEEAQKHNIPIPEFYEVIDKETKKKAKLNKENSQHRYARQLSSYLKTAFPLYNLRSFEKETTRQYNVYIKALG